MHQGITVTTDQIAKRLAAESTVAPAGVKVRFLPETTYKRGGGGGTKGRRADYREAVRLSDFRQ